MTDQAADSDSSIIEQPQTEDSHDPSDSAGEQEEAMIGDADLAPAIEAVLMVVDEPVSTMTLAQVLRRPEADVAQACAQLAEEYLEQGRGFALREIAGGWRYYSSPLYDAFVQRFILDGQQARLTQAALETLAVVAYRQPVSRARISAVRGVNVDGVMRTLLARGLIEECGIDGEHGAHLYQTTGYFLERLGAASLAELPELAPYLPDLQSLEAEL